MDGTISAAVGYKRSIPLISVVCGEGAPDNGCAHGPGTLRDNGLSKRLEAAGVDARWHAPIERAVDATTPVDIVSDVAERLASLVHDALACGERPVVIGGDHSCAIGTWNGVYRLLWGRGPMGLVWIDAHMDCHTPETTPSGNIHGMPLAVLMGHGDPRLTGISRPGPALRPENVCILGVRSYEPEEARLLNRLGVRVIAMQEIRERGLDATLDEAVAIAARASAGFGMSIDLDVVDPGDAPGVGSPVPGGIAAEELIRSVRGVGRLAGLNAIEIAEYNPVRDPDHGTRRVVESLLVSALS